MLSHDAIRSAHRELGRPTDKESVDLAFEEAAKAVSKRSDTHFIRLINEWRDTNGNALRTPDEIAVHIFKKAMSLAEEEILEEWYSGPIRELHASKTKKLTVKIDPDLHQQFRIAAVSSEYTMSELVISWIRAFVAKTD